MGRKSLTPEAERGCARSFIYSVYKAAVQMLPTSQECLRRRMFQPKRPSQNSRAVSIGDRVQTCSRGSKLFVQGEAASH